MSSVVISGDTSGAITLSAPAVAGTNTITLPASTGTAALLQTPSFTTTIGVGGATPSTSGAGITFPITASPSTDSNTLDDYEEGTWTPTAPVTVTASTATYQKIGNTVFLNAFIDVSSNASGTAFTITGVPFVQTDNASVGCFSSTNTDLYAYMSSSIIYIRTNGNATRTCSSLSGAFVAFQIYYKV